MSKHVNLDKVRVTPGGEMRALLVEGPLDGYQAMIAYPAPELYIDTEKSEAPARSQYKLISLVWNAPKPLAIYYHLGTEVIQ